MINPLLLIFITTYKQIIKKPNYNLPTIQPQTLNLKE